MLRMILDQVLRPEVATGFFIAEDGQDNIAGRNKAFSLGPQQGRHHHGHAALHVDSTSAPDAALRNLPFERRIGPTLVGRGDHVYMPVHQHRRSIAASGEVADQVGPVRLAAKDDSMESGGNQQLIDVIHALRLVARRVGGIETDEVLQQLCRILVDGGLAGRRMS
jgi:hypothetical protein